MHVSFVYVSAVCPGNTGWVCRCLGGRSWRKRTFHHSPQGVIPPAFSYRQMVHLEEDPWLYLEHGFRASSLQSQLWSWKGLPLLTLPFSNTTVFAKMVASQKLPDQSRCAAATCHAREVKGLNRYFYWESRFSPGLKCLFTHSFSASQYCRISPLMFYNHKFLSQQKFIFCSNELANYLNSVMSFLQLWILKKFKTNASSEPERQWQRKSNNSKIPVFHNPHNSPDYVIFKSSPVSLSIRNDIVDF